MNAIFVSQSGTIKMFHDLALDLQREMEISEIEIEMNRNDNRSC